MTRRRVAVAVMAVVMGCLFAAPAAAETLKARVLEVDDNEVRVDAAGQPRTYRVNDRSLFAVLRPGRLVIITAELVAGRHTIVQAEPAAQEGRVTGLDSSRATATIRDNESGATGTYYFDEGVSRTMAVGDVVNFDVEERSRRQVIVRWRRIGDSSSGGTGTVNDAGRVAYIDWRQARLTIDLESAKTRQVFDLASDNLLEGMRTGSRIAFQYQRRSSGNPVITSIR